MYGQYLRSALQVGQVELNLPVQSAGSHECGVECVGSVGGHEDFDVAACIEAVELCDDLQHGALYLVVSTCTVVEASAADGVHLVKEHDGGLLRASQLEQLAYHTRALADILLHKLAADDTDEHCVGLVRDGAGEQRFSC